MKNKLFNRKIPTILGIILVLLCIPLTAFIANNQTVFINTASGSQEPQNVKITNISDESFTVTYITEVPSTGSISYGLTKKLGESELESIDKEKGSFSPKKIHSISVKKLIPDTKYYFTIISGSNTYLNNGAPFEAITGPNISSPPAKQITIKGKIVLPDSSPSSETLVYLNAENSQLISSTTANDGNFSFSLEKLRINDLSAYFNTDENTVFKIIATDGFLISSASASLNQTNSLPIITLSNNYDFTQNISPGATGPGGLSGFPSTVPHKNNFKLGITNPKDKQSITDRKPQFRGTSLPNEKVEIIINSNEKITTEVTADINGNWTYKPSTDLSPGAHTITIKTRDSSGILTTIIQSFTVLAAENPTAIPISPSAIPTPMPLPSPTISVFTPLPTPTPAPSPIIVPLKSKGGLPPTGSSSILLIAAGIITAFAGFALLFSVHKASL